MLSIIRGERGRVHAGQFTGDEPESRGGGVSCSLLLARRGRAG